RAPSPGEPGEATSGGRPRPREEAGGHSRSRPGGGGGALPIARPHPESRPPRPRTQHHVRQPTIRSRAPSLPAGLRSELKEEASPRAETGDIRGAGLPVAAGPSRRDRTSEVPCPVPQALNSGQYPPERPHLD